MLIYNDEMVFLKDKEYDNEEKKKLIEISNTKRKIVREMNKLEFELANVGVQYIIETILLIKSNDTLYNLEKDIYPLVAKKYNVSTNRVKWNICSCVNSMYKNNKMSNINEYFGYDFNRRPTPKTLIFTILNKI